MPSAEIIAIGTELLLGETVDTNTAHIAKTLKSFGVDIFRTIIVGDNPSRITRQIRQSLNNADIIITTGGLGPTVDDPTREAVASAFNQKLIFKESLWEEIKLRFQTYGKAPTENNKRQAFIPNNAIAILNPVGTAPAFYVHENDKIVISMPGVPSEMHYLLENSVIEILKSKYDLSTTIFSRTIHTAGIGESTIDSMIGEFEKLSNPTVGVTAKPGRVDIRLNAKAEDKAAALAIIHPIEKELLAILGDYVFGFDDDTLEAKLIETLLGNKMNAALFLESTNNKLGVEFEKSGVFQSISRNNLPDDPSRDNSQPLYNNSNGKTLSVSICEIAKPRRGFKAEIEIGGDRITKKRYYGGHEELFVDWVKNHVFSLMLTNLH